MSLSPLPGTTDADRWTAEDDIWPTEDDKWTMGDFTLVSSDNVTFRIESFYLYSSSAVFREGRSAKAPLLVEFTDTEIETASVLRAFLSLIVEGNVIHQPVDSWAEWTDPIPVSRLVAFLLKYSCDVDLKMLNNCIKMHATTSPLVAFTVAALQDDSAWCSQLLKIPSWPRDTKSPAFSAFGGAPNSSNLDPRGAPLSYWDLFPRHYLWALSRAWTYAPKEQDRFTRSVAFLNFLLAAKEEEKGGPKRPREDDRTAKRTRRE